MAAPRNGKPRHQTFSQPRINMTKKRRVFGRRKVKRGDVVYRLEMRKDKLAARELYSRREFTMTLNEIVDVLTGQLPLKFN
jgi:hypothetical protein